MNLRENVKYNNERIYGYYGSVTLPVREKPKKTTMPKPKKKRKKSSFLVSIVLCLILIGLLAIILPTSYRLACQSYSKKMMAFSTSELSFLSYTNRYWGGFNSAEYLFPTKKYLSNYSFLNMAIDYPISKKNTKMKSLFYGDRLIELEKSLKELNKKYPNIKPSVFVWSMDNSNYADINADAIYPSASIIKIPVLIQMYKSIENEQFGLKDKMYLTEYFRSEGSGKMQYSQAGNAYTTYDLATLMIQDSDNTATNMLISKVGSMCDVNAALREWGIEHTHLQTWLPDITGNNYTTAKDIAQMLFNIGKDDNKFLNFNSQSDIINIMSNVKNTSLIKAGLPDNVPFIHKTGDIGTMLGDAGIVYLPSGQRYVVVILALRPHNHINGRLYIQEASKIIYNYMSLNN